MRSLDEVLRVTRPHVLLLVTALALAGPSIAAADKATATLIDTYLDVHAQHLQSKEWMGRAMAQYLKLGTWR